MSTRSERRARRQRKRAEWQRFAEVETSERPEINPHERELLSLVSKMASDVAWTGDDYR